jgi:hypothetical protein
MALTVGLWHRCYGLIGDILMLGFHCGAVSNQQCISYISASSSPSLRLQLPAGPPGSVVVCGFCSMWTYGIVLSLLTRYRHQFWCITEATSCRFWRVAACILIDFHNY